MTKVRCPKCNPTPDDTNDPDITTGICAHHAREARLDYLRSKGQLAVIPAPAPPDNAIISAVLAIVLQRSLERSRMTLPDRTFTVYQDAKGYWIIFDNWLGVVGRYGNPHSAYARASILRNRWQDRKPA